MKISASAKSRGLLDSRDIARLFGSGATMRTYAPAAADAVLDRLLDEPSLARGVLHHAVSQAREARTAPFPATARRVSISRSRMDPAVTTIRTKRIPAPKARSSSTSHSAMTALS